MDMGVASSQLRAGHLPVEATTFVDRRPEVAEVKRLLAAARLVTLTGVGGSGKTRLAQRAAHELRRAFADGAFWADLGALTDDQLFDHTIAQALGVQDRSDRPVLAAVVDICQRLDGLPLALELAAAQLRTLSVERLAAGLHDQLNLLSARGATPVRHRSLETAFTWSWKLCSPTERALWGRMSVFAD